MKLEFERQLEMRHAAAVLREIGVNSIMMLIWINTLAAMVMRFIGAPMTTFMIGFLAAWVAALVSYLIAQRRCADPYGGRQDNPLFLLTVMILPVAISLLCFCLGLFWAGPSAAI